MSIITYSVPPSLSLILNQHVRSIKGEAKREEGGKRIKDEEENKGSDGESVLIH